MSNYEQMIEEALATLGRSGAASPRHIEAWLRVEHACLDAIPREQFVEEVLIAITCIEIAPFADTVAIAASFGL